MHIEFLKAWYLFAFSLGLWTCLNIVFSRRGHKPVKTTMLLFVGLLLVVPINGYFHLLLDTPIYWLTILSQSLTLAYGPLLFLVIKQSLRQEISFNVSILHFLPFFVVNLDRIFGTHFTSNYFIYLPVLFVQIMSYVVFATVLTTKYKHRMQTLLYGHKNTSYFWLLFLSIGLLAITLFDVVVISLFVSKYTPNLDVVAVIACVVSVYVNVIALFALYQPEIFLCVEEKNETDVDIPKIRNIELSSEAVQELDDRLQKLVEHHKPHLDDEISLPKLASLLGVTRNQLSELFNVHKSVSFYDYLNALRYQESIKLLADDDKTLTIADIAYQAGFNNRNTFYKVFKERSGVTPSQYRKDRIDLVKEARS